MKNPNETNTSLNHFTDFIKQQEFVKFGQIVCFMNPFTIVVISSHANDLAVTRERVVKKINMAHMGEIMQNN